MNPKNNIIRARNENTHKGNAVGASSQRDNWRQEREVARASKLNKKLFWYMDLNIYIYIYIYIYDD